MSSLVGEGDRADQAQGVGVPRRHRGQGTSRSGFQGQRAARLSGSIQVCAEGSGDGPSFVHLATANQRGAASRDGPIRGGPQDCGKAAQGKPLARLQSLIKSTFTALTATRTVSPTLISSRRSSTVSRSCPAASARRSARDAHLDLAHHRAPLDFHDLGLQSVSSSNLHLQSLLTYHSRDGIFERGIVLFLLGRSKHLPSAARSLLAAGGQCACTMPAALYDAPASFSR